MRILLAAAALAVGGVPAMAAQPGTVPAPGATPRIIGAALNVVDLDAAVKFYTEGLGMQVATTLDFGAKTETILMFAVDSTKPSILLMHEKDPAARKPLVHGNAFSRVVLGFPDIQAVTARLDKIGYPHPAIREGAHGVRILMVTDPAGFPLELVQQGTAKG